MFHSFAESVNSTLERSMPILTPIGVIAGFLLGDRISSFAPAVAILFAVITFSGALGMNARDFVTVIRNPLPIILFLISIHIIIPIFARTLAGVVFPAEPAFITGFVLLFSIPTAVSGYIWTTIHNGNGPLSLTLILIDTLLAPIMVPLTVSTLMNASVRIDGTGMFVSLVWMVVIPSILGIVLNEASAGKVPARIAPALRPLAKLLLLAVIAINASRVSSSVTAFEPVFISVAIVCVVLSFSGFFTGSVAGKIAKCGRAETVSVTYGVGLRNISAALVLALNFFPERAAIPVLTGIVFQQTIASFAGVVFIQKKAKNDDGAKAKSANIIHERSAR